MTPGVDGPPRGRLLDLSYELVVEDRALESFLRDAYRDSAAEPTPPVERFGLRRAESGRFEVTRDGEVLDTPARAGWALSSLVWHLNRRIAARAGEGIAIHAGAVERDGRGVMIVGRSGTGKTTTTLALARSGYAYLTDDVTVLAAGGAITGAAKPVGLRRPSLAVLGVDPASVPVPPGEFVSPDAGQALVAASQLGAPLGRPAQLRAVVLLDASAPPGPPVQVARSHTVAALLEHAFDVARLGADALALVAESTTGVTCWRWRPGREGDLRRTLDADVDVP